MSDGNFRRHSFVNGLATYEGGTHENYVMKEIIDAIKSKNASYKNVKPDMVKRHVALFLTARISNPSFTSQAKVNLTTPPSKFGKGAWRATDQFKAKLFKSEIVSNIEGELASKAEKDLAKSDGKRRVRVKVQNLHDAQNAGKKSKVPVSLVITEGDSALAMVMAGSRPSIDKLGRVSTQGQDLEPS